MFKRCIKSATIPTLAIISSLGLNFGNQTFSVEKVWEEYRNSQLQDPVRLRESQNKSIDYNGLSMKYVFNKIGPKPVDGYPLYIALHGGGGAPPQLNDSQWEAMKVYYRDSVKSGIYLAPRGITNTWDLHSVGESFVMYDRLIENMILFEDVNPNRVYVLGYSAGGDGVYQIATRMSDRFAAANMSAGHPNGINVRNLYQLPFLIQVGEVDSAYSRNRVDAEYCGKLERLHESNADGYRTECNIHFQRPHNFLDNQPQGALQKVLSNPQKWLTENNRSIVERNTNAVNWLDHFSRDPIPNRIVWDLTTRANRIGIDRNNKALWSASTHGQQSYWLDIGNHTAESLGTQEIIAHFERATNTVVIEKSAPYLKILLKREMLDFNKKIHVQAEGQSLEVQVQPNVKTMWNTLADRGGPSFIFEAAILLEKNVHGQLSISQVD